MPCYSKNSGNNLLNESSSNFHVNNPSAISIRFEQETFTMAQSQIEDIKRKRKWHISAILIAAIIVTNLPIIWVLLTSFKASVQITNSEPIWVFSPTLDHYVSLFTIKGREVRNVRGAVMDGAEAAYILEEYFCRNL